VKKIQTIFNRPESQKLVIPEPTEAYQLCVLSIPTLKRDGAAAMVLNGTLYRRRICPIDKVPPKGFVEVEVFGNKRYGWILPDPTNPEDKYYLSVECPLVDGTYELIGPKVQGNAERELNRKFVLHGSEELPTAPVPTGDVPRDFERLKTYFDLNHLEGIVYWKNGSPVGKIKRRDFGYRWP
jgi:hypothetical protein